MIPVLLGAAAIWGISNVADAEFDLQARALHRGVLLYPLK